MRRLVIVACVLCTLHAFAQTDKLWYQAEQEYGRRDYKAAQKTLTKITTQQPQSLRAHFLLGSAYFYEGNFAEAAKVYEATLALNAKSDDKLPRDLFRALTDNYGMALGISGQLEKSRAVFEAAIKDDPDYPLYHYNLACGWAEENKMDEAIKHLRNGWERRSNLLQGETFPNPRTDDSFKRFLGKPKFEAALKEMGF